MTWLLAGSGGTRQAAAATTPAVSAAATIVDSAIGRCMAAGSSGSEAQPIKTRRLSAHVAELPQLVLPVGGQLGRGQRGRGRVAVLVGPSCRQGAQARGDRRL